MSSATPRQRLLAVVAAVLVFAAGAFAAVTSLTNSNSGSSAHPWLGAQMSSTPVLGGGFQTGFGGFPFAAGALITRVTPGSPAAGAGLVPGDVITAVGNDSVSTPAQVNSAIAAMHVGDRVPIQYQQGPLTYTAAVVLAAQPKVTP